MYEEEFVCELPLQADAACKSDDRDLRFTIHHIIDKFQPELFQYTGYEVNRVYDKSDRLIMETWRNLHGHIFRLEEGEPAQILYWWADGTDHYFSGKDRVEKRYFKTPGDEAPRRDWTIYNSDGTVLDTITTTNEKNKKF